MSHLKARSLKPIFDSIGDVHLTAYVPHSSDHHDVASNLIDVIQGARLFLEPVMTEKERASFLAPVERLLDESEMITRLHGNLGLFRTADSFRVLSLPVSVEPTCIVATTFHIKPLLRWLQEDATFVLIGFDDKLPSVYLGDMRSLRAIFPAVYTSSTNPVIAVDDMLDWLGDLARPRKPRVFMAGEGWGVERAFELLSAAHMTPTVLSNSFSRTAVVQLVEDARNLLRIESGFRPKRVLRECERELERKRAISNLESIAKASIAGQVKTLVIADGLQLFGKLNTQTGDVKVTAVDLDHEDDDVLDDLAQIVLAKGGEVVLAEYAAMPRGRPALALLR